MKHSVINIRTICLWHGLIMRIQYIQRMLCFFVMASCLWDKTLFANNIKYCCGGKKSIIFS